MKARDGRASPRKLKGKRPYSQQSAKPKEPVFDSIHASRYIGQEAAKFARMAAIPFSGISISVDKAPSRELNHELLNEAALNAIRRGQASETFLRFVGIQAERARACGKDPEHYMLGSKGPLSLITSKVTIVPRKEVGADFSLKAIEDAAREALKAGKYRRVI